MIFQPPQLFPHIFMKARSSTECLVIAPAYNQLTYSLLYLWDDCEKDM